MAGKVLDPHLWNLENLFKSIYDVPVYQRPYSWDKEQVDVLLDDIIETYKSESKEEGYYTGNIIVFDKNDKINGLITKYQLHVDVLYNPASENESYNESRWSDDSEESIFDYIRKSQVFDYAKNSDYEKVEIFLEET